MLTDAILSYDPDPPEAEREPTFEIQGEPGLARGSLKIECDQLDVVTITDATGRAIWRSQEHDVADFLRTIATYLRGES